MEFQKPAGFENSLSLFGPILYDSYCGEPVASGFKITQRLGDEMFVELGKHGQLECIDHFNPAWALIVKTLSREDAVTLYGEITEEILGPRGGWKSTTFGNKKFASKYLKPVKASR